MHFLSHEKFNEPVIRVTPRGDTVLPPRFTAIDALRLGVESVMTNTVFPKESKIKVGLLLNELYKL